ncbi:MAG: DUF393 domain-containing protein [Planctomycetota bacterium]
MNQLTVLYDASCHLCCRARRWLENQEQYVPLRFVGAATDHAKREFPYLDPEDTLQELTVVGDDGSIYRGAKAWVMCLWALVDHRGKALTIVSPALLPSARRFIDWVSRNRR